MAIYVKENNKVADIFANVNGSKKRITSAWVNRNGEPTKCFSTAKSPIKMVTWADGTWDAISAMLDAHYAGEIDIADYWSLGDNKTVDLSAMDVLPNLKDEHEAQQIQLTIVDFKHHDLVTPIKTVSTSAITLHMKDCLNDAGYMYVTNSNNSIKGWDSSPRRLWCNTTFKNALPSELQNLIKTVKTSAEDSLSYIISNDDCFLLSESEVFGEKRYGNGQDGYQCEYYKNQYNRIKQRYSSNGYDWWTRTVCTNGSSNYCYVLNDGSYSKIQSANRVNGLVVAMCI